MYENSSLSICLKFLFVSDAFLKKYWFGSQSPEVQLGSKMLAFSIHFERKQTNKDSLNGNLKQFVYLGIEICKSVSIEVCPQDRVVKESKKHRITTLIWTIITDHGHRVVFNQEP